jgi:hypothetical protein
MVVILPLLLVLPLFFQGNVEVVKVGREEPKKNIWTNGQIAEFQKELALIQKINPPYDGTIKPDLVPDVRIPQPDPQFLPNAIPGDNQPIFIPIKPLTSKLMWLISISRGD